MSLQSLETFSEGTEIEIVECGEVIDVVRVVSDKRSEIEVEDKNGQRTTFAHFAQQGGWKMLFKGMGGERCFSQRAPVYQIRKKQ